MDQPQRLVLIEGSWNDIQEHDVITLVHKRSGSRTVTQAYYLTNSSRVVLRVLGFTARSEALRNVYDLVSIHRPEPASPEKEIPTRPGTVLRALTWAGSACGPEWVLTLHGNGLWYFSVDNPEKAGARYKPDQLKASVGSGAFTFEIIYDPGAVT